jgi:hypothetical protein
MSKDLHFEMMAQEAPYSLELINLNNLMNLSKSSIQTVVGEVTTKVANGDVDAIKALIYAKKGLELLGAIEKNVRPYAESHPIPKGGVEMYSCQLIERMSGVKTDYSACGDPVWDLLDSQLEGIIIAKKEREKFLSGISKPTEIVNEYHEVFTLNPPIKSGKMGIALSIK